MLYLSPLDTIEEYQAWMHQHHKCSCGSATKSQTCPFRPCPFENYNCLCQLTLRHSTNYNPNDVYNAVVPVANDIVPIDDIVRPTVKRKSMQLLSRNLVDEDCEYNNDDKVSTSKRASKQRKIEYSKATERTCCYCDRVISIIPSTNLPGIKDGICITNEKKRMNGFYDEKANQYLDARQCIAKLENGCKGSCFICSWCVGVEQTCPTCFLRFK